MVALKYVRTLVYARPLRTLGNPAVLDLFLSRARSPDLSAGLPELPDIKNKYICSRVFTHRSLYMRPNMLFQDPDDDPSPDNERLEFLGDATLGLVTATLLENDYPLLRVGPTSKVKALVVSNENLSAICKYYRLHGRLKCAPNQTLTLQSSAQIQANLLESYIGGLYLDQGFDAVRDWLSAVLRPYVKEAFSVIRDEHLLNRATSPEEGEISDPNKPEAGSVVDPGTLAYFNQWCSQNKSVIDWRFKDIAGTKSTPLWCVEVWMDGNKIAEGVSTGKKGAKTEGAKRALQALGINLGL